MGDMTLRVPTGQIPVARSLMPVAGRAAIADIQIVSAQNTPTRERMKIARMDRASETDRQDIEASLNGDEEAFAHIVKRYQGEIAGYMWRFTRNPVDCEELVHDVFVEAFLSLRRFKGTAPFRHWIKKIATRVGYRYWKGLAKEKTHRVATMDEARPPYVKPHEIEDQIAATEYLHRIMSLLPPRDHLVLTLLYLEECSIGEAAQLTGWSRAMVKVQAYRARKKLLKIIEQEDRR